MTPTIGNSFPLCCQTLNAIATLGAVGIHDHITNRLVGVTFRRKRVIGTNSLLTRVSPHPCRGTLLRTRNALLRGRTRLGGTRISIRHCHNLFGRSDVTGRALSATRTLINRCLNAIGAGRTTIGSTGLGLRFAGVHTPVAKHINLHRLSINGLITTGSAATLTVVARARPVDIIFALPRGDLSAILTHCRANTGLPIRT